MKHKSINFLRFLDLHSNNLNFDYHIHTNQSDGLDSIETILMKAKEMKISKIAFTEHVRKDTDWFDFFVDSVHKSAVRYPELTVYVGCETKAIDTKGNLDVSDKILNKCDIVLGCVHRIPNDFGGFYNFSMLSVQKLLETEFELSVGMLEKSPIDVLAHPGGMFSSRYGGYPIEYFRELIKLANNYKKTIELNSRYMKNTYDLMLTCADLNPKISLGSDAHRADDIGSCSKLITVFGLSNFQKEKNNI